MQVYFNKLDNGDWICYDQMNITGDLFVDPEKIELLFELLPKEDVSRWVNSKNVTLFQRTCVDIPGFGKTHMYQYIEVTHGKIIRSYFRENDGESIARWDTRFMLDLPELPKFEEYVYPSPEGEDEKDQSGE